MTEPGVLDSIEDVFREEHGRLLAALVRQFNDLDLAEDAASEAMEAALRRWPVDGVPRVPLAWLITTARRKAVDRLRRDEAFRSRLAILHVEAEHLAPAPADPGSEDIPDERLRLFFACCHPALSLDAQVALTLRYLGGLSTTEIARSFLVAESAMQQRLVRAKQKIRVARIPFRVPERDELARRLPAVLHTLYLIFTEGYAPSTGDDVVRVELSEDAIRLARTLHRLLPDEPEVGGLLALFLLTDARRPARRDASGDLVSLEDQDRSRWDVERITEGRNLVVDSLQTSPAGPYAVQAAIAAVHSEAATVGATDWAQIVALFDILAQIAPSPVVQLNRAVALGMRDTPDDGLAALDTIDPVTLRESHRLPAARADLLRRAGRMDEAATAYRAAIALAANGQERRFLFGRLASCRGRAARARQREG
jgi:RNA polymerase sigma-70 factor (ECF subfamily)